MPDISALISDNTLAWVVYLSLDQVRIAGLCLLALLWVGDYATKVVLWAGSAWFIGQGIDEAFFGNRFHQGLWEYPCFAIYALLLYLHIRRHDHKEGVEHQEPD